MIAAAVRPARAALGAWLLVLCATASAAEPQVPLEDRRWAERLAAQAEAAEEAGDHREATRLLQRAVRWDPTRIEDRRRVVAWLEPIDPLAAIRHADRLLEIDERYGLDDPTRLTRLATLARESPAIDAAPIAARLSRRLIAWGSQEGRLKPHQLAKEWFAAGTEHCETLDYESGSQAFEELQRLALTHPIKGVRGDINWGAIAAIHLKAAQVDRALVAIGLLKEEEGDTYETRALQARAALALGEPLAAIEHAEHAIKLAGEQVPLTRPEASPYVVLIEACRAINQERRAIDVLKEIRTTRPRDTALAISLSEQLVNQDRQDEAWELMRAEVERLLVAVDAIPAEEDSAEATHQIRDHRRRLGKAFMAWVPLARSTERAEAVLAQTPPVFDRLAGTTDLSDALRSFAMPSGVRARVKDWLKEPISQEGAPGRARAGVAFALAVSDTRAVTRSLKLRLGRMRRAGAGQAEIDAEFFDAHYALLNRSEFETAVDLMRWMRAADSVDEGEGEGSGRLRAARMMSDLAFAISRSLPEEPELRAARVAEVIELAERVERDAPEAFRSVLDTYYALGACDADRAIAMGERLLERWPVTHLGDGVDPDWRRELVNSIARKRQARGAAGDSERAFELDELLLDQDPSDDRALNNLAYEFALQDQGLARAERMARRAVELAPDEPNYYDTHGWTLFKLGRLGAAKAVLAEGLGRVEDATPQEVVDALHEHLAAVDRALGLAEEAEAEAAP